MVGKIGKGEFANALFCIGIFYEDEFIGYLVKQNRPYRSPFLKDARFYKTKRATEEQIDTQRKWNYKESFYKLCVFEVRMLPERID